jgi:hypothetical protein
MYKLWIISAGPLLKTPLQLVPWPCPLASAGCRLELLVASRLGPPPGEKLEVEHFYNYYYGALYTDE